MVMCLGVCVWGRGMGRDRGPEEAALQEPSPLS